MSAENALAGQVAWVTGSSRGLGRVMATTLCKMGARVAVHGTRPDSPRSFGEGETMTRKSGRIITIGSIAGLFGRDDGVIYSVAKAGVHEYTRCLAIQLRPYNVPVNCVAPGGTVTNRFLVIHDIEQQKLVEEGTLVRYGRPHEVASVVAFLAGEEGRF